MAKRRIKNESFENLKHAINDESIDTCGTIDVVTETACLENKMNEEHVEEVMSELKNAAAAVTPEDTHEDEEGTPKVDARLILDESVEDFKLKEDVIPVTRQYDREETDPLDFDMFDFTYSLFTDGGEGDEKPLDALGKKDSFMTIGSDDYINNKGPNNHAQVGVSGNSIDLYGESAERFDGVIELCNKYKLTYSGPYSKRSSTSFYPFRINIKVPLDASGYPMLLVDYIQELGMELSDVMPADFCKKYNRIRTKMDAELSALANDNKVNSMIDSAIKKAFADSDPLEKHLKQLFTDLDNAELKYVRKHVKDKFMSAMNDDPYAMDEDLLSAVFPAAGVISRLSK